MDKMKKAAEVRLTNNFDFLRFAAASLVIITHSWVLLGKGEDWLAGLTGIGFSHLGVTILFTISGYLICRSWLSKPDLLRFCWARFLRLMPALIPLVLLTVFLLGPLATTLPLGQYFTDADTYKYFLVLGLVKTNYGLPGVFACNPAGPAVNGSLWTLRVEVFLYACLLAIGALGLLRRDLVLPAAVLATVIAYASVSYMFPGEGAVLLALFYCACFFIGALYFTWKEWLRFDWRAAAALLVLLALSFNSPFLPYASLAALPYLILMFAFLPVKWLHQFGKYGDFSYGMYIYAYPVQQSVFWFTGGNVSYWEMLAISFSVTLALAVLSWKLVESRALALKDRLQSRKR